MYKKFKILTLMIIVFATSGCKQDVIPSYTEQQIKEFVAQAKVSIDKDTSSKPPFMIFSDQISTQNSSSFIYWVNSDKAKKMNPLLLIFDHESSEKKSLKSIIVYSEETGYCYIEENQSNGFPEKCIRFNGFIQEHEDNLLKRVFVRLKDKEQLLLEIR